jgi:hypothetical protein
VLLQLGSAPGGTFCASLPPSAFRGTSRKLRLTGDAVAGARGVRRMTLRRAADGAIPLAHDAAAESGSPPTSARARSTSGCSSPMRPIPASPPAASRRARSSARAARDADRGVGLPARRARRRSGACRSWTPSTTSPTRRERRRVERVVLLQRLRSRRGLRLLHPHRRPPERGQRSTPGCRCGSRARTSPPFTASARRRR